MILDALLLIPICIMQNIAFSLVSRARNRDNMTYHAVASVFSNAIWFLTIKYMIDLDMAWYLIFFYVIGTVIGSVYGAKISMQIEKLIGASADKHLEEEPVTVLQISKTKKVISR